MVKMVHGRWLTLTFLLQAWRKYDSDRSGYIEANELKVKRDVQRSLTWKLNVGWQQHLGQEQSRRPGFGCRDCSTLMNYPPR